MTYFHIIPEFLDVFLAFKEGGLRVDEDEEDPFVHLHICWLWTRKGVFSSFSNTTLISLAGSARFTAAERPLFGLIKLMEGKFLTGRGEGKGKDRAGELL